MSDMRTDPGQLVGRGPSWSAAPCPQGRLPYRAVRESLLSWSRTHRLPESEPADGLLPRCR